MIPSGGEVRREPTWMRLRDLLLLLCELLDGRFFGFALYLSLQMLGCDELGPQLVQRREHGVLLVPTGVEGRLCIVVECGGKREVVLSRGHGHCALT